MHTKLDDIHTWFKQNVQGQHAASTVRSQQHQPDTEQPVHERFYFSVSIHAMPDRVHGRLHCSKATFQDNWLDEEDPFKATPSIFQCCCSRSQNSAVVNHVDALHVSCKASVIPTNRMFILISCSSIKIQYVSPSGCPGLRIPALAHVRHLAERTAPE
jgi:hypothetical protein